MARVIVCLMLVCSICGTGLCLSTRQAIAIDNKVLVSVRDQVITVMDIVKKLDLAFYQQSPELRSLPSARYEFYMTHWRQVLDDLVARRLTLLFAEDKNIRVTQGEVKEELEEMTGPNVLMSIYEAGLSIHDMQQMVKEDMLLRRVFFFYVRKYVMDSITPERIRVEYNRRSEMPDQVWHWRFVTIHSTQPLSQEIAEHVRSEFIQGKEKPVLPDGVELTISSAYCSKKSELAEAIRDVLSPLKPKETSSLIPWKSRASSNQGWRFYVLDNAEITAFPPLAAIEHLIREELAAPELAKRAELFFKELRLQYGVVDTMTPEQLALFVPFSLQQ